MASPIFDPRIDDLATLLEEGARASAHSVKRFIEPMNGTLRRAQSKRHHVVFGRRGSGKSSLLLKTAQTLAESGVPVAYVDLEPFKGHHYPDVLISVLLAALTKFQSWLKEQDSFRARTWRTLWLWKSKTSKARLRTELQGLLAETVGSLRRELHLTDAAQLVEMRRSDTETSDSAHAKSTGTASVGWVESSVEAEISSQAKSSDGQEIQEEYTRSKIDLLHRRILDYHRIFDSLSELTGEDAFLFVDDLYHIIRGDQAKILDYFHRVAKGHGLWLKVGTIKHRSTWYVHSPQPLGMKMGDDADDIDLDLTLEKFSTSRNFLSQVAATYVEEARTPSLDTLLTNTGLDRLVMASGGVTRDFLAILRRSIDEARERLTRDPEHSRGERIGAEDINRATGSYGVTKREEFQKDTLDDQERLDEAFKKIGMFCLEKTKANVFLIDQEMTNKDSDLVQELIDLRLVHHVRSRVTVSARPGRVYRALLLDVSQYTGERKRRNIEMLEFWKEDREILRRVRLIYDPTMSLQELRSQIEQHQTPTSTVSKQDSDPRQGELGLSSEQ